MLTHLTIRNLAVIKDLEIKFREGMSVITGETGAGKSIIIDALGLILGDRANTLLVRDGEEIAYITAEFTVEARHRRQLMDILDKLEINLENDLEIQREVNRNGKSRATLNGSHITVGDLRSIGSLLVEMHGQHEHQRLLDPESHMGYLDACIRNTDLFSSLEKAFRAFRSCDEELKTLTRDRQRYEADYELKTYHLAEMEALDLKDGELIQLEEEAAILEHSHELSEAADMIAQSLYESDENLVDQLKEIKRSLSRISAVDTEQAALMPELETAVISLTELGRSMSGYRDSIPDDPGRLDTVRHRLHELYRLEKKHQKPYPELYSYYLSLKTELQNRQDFDSVMKRKTAEREALRSDLTSAAARLSERRRQEARDFAASINDILRKMGMKHASLSVSFSTAAAGSSDNWVVSGNDRVHVNENGIDVAEFLIITNPGENFKPLSQVVSGGELSRVMLAIKGTLSEKDVTATLIFDEADAGISGQIARTVGEQILDLAGHHQVLCITHLPQIASLGHSHFQVTKTTGSGHSETTMTLLSDEERIREIASLISAGPISQASLQTATELLNQQKGTYGTTN